MILPLFPTLIQRSNAGQPNVVMPDVDKLNYDNGDESDYEEDDEPTERLASKQSGKKSRMGIEKVCDHKYVISYMAWSSHWGDAAQGHQHRTCQGRGASHQSQGFQRPARIGSQNC